jgi:hypothetical protein
MCAAVVSSDSDGIHPDVVSTGSSLVVQQVKEGALRLSQEVRPLLSRKRHDARRRQKLPCNFKLITHYTTRLF